jgi:hypothetical protein
MSGRSSGFMLLKAGFCQRMCKRRHLPRAFETAFDPPRPKDVALRKICIFTDSAPAYSAKTAQRLLAEFRFLADWQPYSLNLNSLDFDTRHVLQAKAQALPHANFAALRPSVIAEWDRLAAVQIRKTSVFAGERVNADDF